MLPSGLVDDGTVPLIQIESLATPDVDRAAICRTLNAEVATALGARLEAVWTTWRTIELDVRGDDARGDDTRASIAPIVHLFHHRTAEQVERVVEVIENVLARELSIDSASVFVTTQPVSMPDPTLE